VSDPARRRGPLASDWQLELDNDWSRQPDRRSQPAASQPAPPAPQPANLLGSPEEQPIFRKQLRAVLLVCAKLRRVLFHFYSHATFALNPLPPSYAVRKKKNLF